MWSDLHGKTALVTGGARRVGREICRRLAAAGANIVFSYRQSRAEADELRSDLQGKGAGVLAVQAELSELDACDHLIAEALRSFGKVDILVNNASEFPRTPLSGLAADRPGFERLLGYLSDLHVRAPLYLGLRLGLEMKRSGGGRIVNVTDRVVARGQAYRDWSLYVVTKYGLHGVTQALALELAPEVTVNSVAPGMVLPSPNQSEEEAREQVRKAPLGRAAGVDEIAEDVLHLVRSEAKTGSLILTDCGAGLSAD